MAMGTGAKIAIGCGCLLLLGAVAAVGVVGLGAWWAKDRLGEAAVGLEKVAARADEISRFEKAASAHPYRPAPDGAISEDRLLAFLEARKRVHSVYGRYEARLADLQGRAGPKGDQLSPSDLWKAGGTLAEAFSEIRLAQVQALAELGMNEEEYRAIQLAVYKSAWASDVEKDSGRMPAEAVSSGMTEAAQQMQEAMRAGLEAARKEGVPGAARVSDEDVLRLQEQMARLGEGAGSALDVPRSNVELFRKHEAEIKKYAMHGLAFLGL